jgi:hypothetical protein
MMMLKKAFLTFTGITIKKSGDGGEGGLVLCRFLFFEQRTQTQEEEADAGQGL